MVRVEIPASLNNSVLAYHKTQLLLAADNYLIHIRSLLDQPTQYDFSRMKTYLRSLKLQFGLIVNFGKKTIANLRRQVHLIKSVFLSIRVYKDSEI